MRPLKFVMLFGTLSLVFMGCPYESKIPLDSPDKAKSDKDLPGKYTEKDSESYLWDCKPDGNQYRITKKSTEDSESEPTIYIGFLSDVGGVSFMNVYEDEGSSEKSYMIYRIEKKNADRWKLKAMTDNVTEEFTTSDEFKTFVKKNMELSFFYNKDDEKTFYREDE
ncbi:MAG TPA: hypothetical protein VK826_20825 [Bacteroidia bacterium]|nr:hypothetical protein [Bacteroidia bacterium]